MRKRLFFFCSWVLIVLGLPLLGLAALASLFNLHRVRDAITDGYLAFLARIMLWLSGSRVEIQGLQNIPASEPVLFVSNHQGHFDSAVLLAYVRQPKAFVASSAASKFPIFSIWFRFAYTVYLERDNVRQNYTALEKAKEVIEEGRSVVIYPEGIISSGPQTGEFKRGAFRPAFSTGIPIVPVVIDGTWKVMGEKNDTIQPTTIIVKILPAVPTKGLGRQEQQELPAKIYASIIEALEKIQRN